MTIEELKELYYKYEEANLKYNRFVYQFFIITINPSIMKKIARTRRSQDVIIIEGLGKIVDSAKVQYERALKNIYLHVDIKH